MLYGGDELDIGKYGVAMERGTCFWIGTAGRTTQSQLVWWYPVTGDTDRRSHPVAQTQLLELRVRLTGSVMSLRPGCTSV